VACGLAACTTQEANPAGTGGSGGQTSSPGGSGGSGGTTGGTALNGTPCPVPAEPLLTDFTYATGATSTTEVHFGDATTLEGGQFVYPTSGSFALTSDVTQSNWHISGTVGDYSGFGLVFYNCSVANAAKYKGIKFTVSGTVGNTNPMTFGVTTLNSSITIEWIVAHNETSTDPGRCVPTSGTSKYYEQGCVDPTFSFTVGATPATVSALWTDFTGGSPDAYVKTPNEIIHVYWRFPWASGYATYPVDIVVDDISFIP
jgi:hypothetical protein